MITLINLFNMCEYIKTKKKNNIKYFLKASIKIF